MSTIAVAPAQAGPTRKLSIAYARAPHLEAVVALDSNHVVRAILVKRDDAKIQFAGDLNAQLLLALSIQNAVAWESFAKPDHQYLPFVPGISALIAEDSWRKLELAA